VPKLVEPLLRRCREKSTCVQFMNPRLAKGGAESDRSHAVVRRSVPIRVSRAVRRGFTLVEDRTISPHQICLGGYASELHSAGAEAPAQEEIQLKKAEGRSLGIELAWADDFIPPHTRPLDRWLPDVACSRTKPEVWALRSLAVIRCPYQQIDSDSANRCTFHLTTVLV